MIILLNHEMTCIQSHQIILSMVVGEDMSNPLKNFRPVVCIVVSIRTPS
jgi:hypothetical protein